MTTFKYFKFRPTQQPTIEEIKKQYHKLAMENHPDRGGDLRTMQEINAEFDELRKRYYNVHTSKSGGTYRDEKQQAPDDVTAHFVEIIAALLKLDGVGIEICGSFIWLSGNTFDHKAEIKALGFRWASKKKQWFKAPEGWKKKGRRELSMDEIRNAYGSNTVREGSEPKKRKGIAA